MSNYKIRVANKGDIKEAQELFFELGYKWACGEKQNPAINECPTIIRSHDSGCMTWSISSEPLYGDHKEITIPELRDLVVLKRNDVGDANYETNYGTQCYITGEDVYAFQDNKWFLSAMQHKDILDMIKPIEKKEMKEYLDKQQDGTYKLIKADGGCIDRDWIEIPEGAIKAYLNNSKTINFINANDDYMNTATNGEWIDTHRGKHEACDHELIWQRAKHPEELPFIDDEPKLDTQMACMEREFERDQCMENARREGLLGDPRIGAPLNTYDEPSVDTYKSEFGIEPPISLNDQYAEIETVRQTLNQRQEQYGSFEDVAMITEQMVDVMRKGYYENLAYNQKMALYMICSKMARIVNGNPNHKDSWHDIAGYATLIDNELVSEKDMPF